MSGQVFLPSLVQPKWWIRMQQVELSKLRHLVYLFKCQVPHKDWNSLFWQKIWIHNTCERMATFVLYIHLVTTTSEITRRTQVLWQSWRQTSARGVLEGVTTVGMAWWPLQFFSKWCNRTVSQSYLRCWQHQLCVKSHTSPGPWQEQWLWEGFLCHTTASGATLKHGSPHSLNTSTA